MGNQCEGTFLTLATNTTCPPGVLCINFDGQLTKEKCSTRCTEEKHCTHFNFNSINCTMFQGNLEVRGDCTNEFCCYEKSRSKPFTCFFFSSS